MFTAHTVVGDVTGNCIFHIERKKERGNVAIGVSKSSREETYEI
jgi:hypothetical protein